VDEGVRGCVEELGVCVSASDGDGEWMQACVCVCVCVCVVQGWWLCGVVLWRIFFLHYRDIMCEFVSLCPLQSLIDC